MEAVVDTQSLILLDWIFECSDFDNDERIRYYIASIQDLKIAAGLQSDNEANQLLAYILSVLNLDSTENSLSKEEFQSGILYFPEFIEKFKQDLSRFQAYKAASEEISAGLDIETPSLNETNEDSSIINDSSIKYLTFHSPQLYSALKRNLSLLDQSLRLNLDNPAISDDLTRTPSILTSKDDSIESLSEANLLHIKLLEKKLRDSRLNDSSSSKDNLEIISLLLKGYNGVLSVLKGGSYSKSDGEYSFLKSDQDKESSGEETGVYSARLSFRFDKLAQMKSNLMAKQLECKKMYSIMMLYELRDVSFSVSEFKKYRLSLLQEVDRFISPEVKNRSARYSSRLEEGGERIRYSKSEDWTLQANLFADKEQDMEQRMISIQEDYNKQINQLRDQNNQLFKLLKQERLRNNTLRTTSVGRNSLSPFDSRENLADEIGQIRRSLTSSPIKPHYKIQNHLVDQETQADALTIPPKVIPIPEIDNQKKKKGDKGRFCGFSFW
jgi:hypothetical protein